MKRMLILIISGLFILSSCNKSSPGKTFSPGLSGKWRYAQHYYSNGGPLIYESAEGLNQWIVFNADSSFSSNMPQFEKVTSYELTDSSRVKFITVQQPTFRLYYYSLDSTDNSLSLEPADMICIEGCGDKFKR